MAWYILITLLIGCTIGIEIDPKDIVARVGETVSVVCKVRQPVQTCFWEINKKSFIPQEGHRLQPSGRFQDGQCGVQVSVTEADNGEWLCNVFSTGAPEAERASTNVTILALPRIQIDSSGEELPVQTNKETTLTCIVSGARPVPAVYWKIGDRDIEPVNTKYEPPTREGLVTITTKLQYTFEPREHGETVACVTAGRWLYPDDPHEAVARLNVKFPPQPKELQTLYGFVAGQPGDIVVNFTANPPPVRVFWKLEDGTELDVQPYSGRTAPDQRIEVKELRRTNDVSYEARLRLRSISESDARRMYRLVVQSDIDGNSEVQEYMVRISMNAAPAQSGGVSGGGVAGIIIAILAIVVIFAVVLYARKTGRWCFAGTKTVGVSTKVSIDEEPVAVDEVEVVRTDSGSRRSLTHRLSSIYESILTKAALNKKNDRTTGVSNNAADVESKEGVVYAELDLRTPTEPVIRVPEGTTEYAEIVGLSQAKGPEVAQELGSK